MKFLLIVVFCLIPVLICQEVESNVSDSVVEQVENLENVTENHEPENEAVPEENRVVDIAVETPPVSPESVQVETNSNSTEKKDSEINSKNLISNSASSSYFSGVFSLLSIVSLLL